MKELLNILNEIRPDIDFKTENKLITNGILDSLDLIALIDELSDYYGINIKPYQLSAENFDSSDAILKLINKLR